MKPTLRLLVGLAMITSGVACARSSASALAPERLLPPPVLDQRTPARSSEVAVIAGGCFWGVQGIYQHVKGVTGAVSGYAGGEESSAEYEKVGTGRTGHAEAVRISFDPRVVSYGRLLQIFFSVAHDPTELNRQGPDEGPQYRSAIFPQNEEQASIAKAYIAQLSQAAVFAKPVMTTLEPAKMFFRAEGYHQDFLERNPGNAYIA